MPTYDWETKDDKIKNIIGSLKDTVSPATASVYEMSGVLDTATPESVPATPENFNRSMERASRISGKPGILNLRVSPSNPQPNLGGEVPVPPQVTNTVLENNPGLLEKQNEVIPTPIVSGKPGAYRSFLFTRQGKPKVDLGPATIKEEGKPSPESKNSMGTIIIKKLLAGEDISPGEEVLALNALKVDADKRALAQLKTNTDYRLADENEQYKMLNDLSGKIAEDTIGLMKGKGRKHTGQPSESQGASAGGPGKKPKIISITRNPDK